MAIVLVVIWGRGAIALGKNQSDRALGRKGDRPCEIWDGIGAHFGIWDDHRPESF